MTPLTQQLEDKKKGCRRTTGYWGRFQQNENNCGVNGRELCEVCQAEIAILEQAISEIKCKDEEIAQLKEKKWTTRTITPLYDYEFHNIDCMTDNNGNVNFFGYYNDDLNHPDYRPSSSIKLKELDAEFLYRLFTKNQQAEMQKQRQEILDKIRLEFHTFREEFIESELDIEDFDIGNLLYNIEQQLNQPKEEQ